MQPSLMSFNCTVKNVSTYSISIDQTYYNINTQEGAECIALGNMDMYPRNIPEDLIMSIDDDD